MEITRDLYQELRNIGLTHDHCSEVLDWVDTLPVHIEGSNITVNKEGGITKVNTTNGRYAVLHIPSNSFVHIDEAGVFLDESDEFLMTYSSKEKANGVIEHLSDYYTTHGEPDMVHTEDGVFSINEFKVITI